MADIAYEKQLQTATQYLAKTDPVLAPIISTHGPCIIRPHHNYYEALVGEIISQQLSVKAAASIHGRFIGLFNGTFPEPAAILRRDIEEFRTAGLSRPKARYIQDLAEQIIAGKIQFDQLDKLDNAGVIAELTAAKGIGEWTAHMFLMFCMGRLDVLAYGDLGIRSAMRDLYGLLPCQPPMKSKQLPISVIGTPMRR